MKLNISIVRELLRGPARNGLLRNVSQIHIQKHPSMHLKVTDSLLS